MTSNQCTSCTMPIESGALCQYCGNEHGELRPFEELFERMVQWSMKERPGAERAAAELQTLQFMSQQPAWRDHAEIRKRLGKG